MQQKNILTVIILTLNEEQDLPECLDSLRGEPYRVVVVDSGSEDRTVEIAKKYNAEVFVHQFTNFEDQRNWALGQAQIATDWVLMLDADECLTDAVKNEIRAIVTNANLQEAGFFIPFQFVFLGRILKRSALPLRKLVLFKPASGRYKSYSGFSERFVTVQKTGNFKNEIIHKSRKKIGAWIAKHNHYANYEAQNYLLLKKKQLQVDFESYLSEEGKRRQTFKRIVWVHLPGKPVWRFLYLYVIRFGFTEGMPGFVFCFLQFLFEAMIAIKYWELNRKYQDA